MLQLMILLGYLLLPLSHDTYYDTCSVTTITTIATTSTTTPMTTTGPSATTTTTQTDFMIRFAIQFGVYIPGTCYDTTWLLQQVFQRCNIL